MCGSVASFQPTGPILSRLNSNTPTLLVPALSNSCAMALSITPVISNEKLIAFMVDLSVKSARRGTPDHALGVARDQLPRQLRLLQFSENLEAHAGKRVGVGAPAHHEFSERWHP